MGVYMSHRPRICPTCWSISHTNVRADYQVARSGSDVLGFYCKKHAESFVRGLTKKGEK